jgi:hypothetical protein
MSHHSPLSLYASIPFRILFYFHPILEGNDSSEA